MNREEAVALLGEHVKGQFLLNHMFATEAIMREVAAFLGEDVEVWGMTGLCHDVDFEETKDNVSQHGLLAEKYLRGKIPEQAVAAIKAHAYKYNGTPAPTDKLGVALCAADAATGLIIAAALVKPDKKLASVTADSVKNAFKKKGFAAGSDRGKMRDIETAGVPLEKFFGLSLVAMQKIAPQLGL